MTAPGPTRLSGEEGFTLVELLVTISIGLVVLFATLYGLDQFTSSAAHQTKVTDANDQVRSTMDRTVLDLRGSSVILWAGSTDLVYAVPVSSSATRIRRLCIASGDLYGSTTAGPAAPTGGAPAAACSSTTKLANLRSTQTTFTYDGASSSTTPQQVKNVGLTFSLDVPRGTSTASSTLKASAARRSAGTLPITDDDLDATCNSAGALLSLGVSLPGFGPLTVTYANSGGISLGTPTGTSLQIPRGITSVVATVTNALGVTNTIKKDIQCD